MGKLNNFLMDISLLSYKNQEKGKKIPFNYGKGPKTNVYLLHI
jgi:hypothetical protein